MESTILTKLTEEDRNQFILDNQYAFKYGISVDYTPSEEELADDGEIISRKTIEMCIDNGIAYRINDEGKFVGGLILKISKDGTFGELEILFVNPNYHNKGYGYKAWKEVERLYPNVKVWETVTPTFEVRNIHFYVNKCGFSIVKCFNSYCDEENDLKHEDIHDSTSEEIPNEGPDEMYLFRKVIE